MADTFQTTGDAFNYSTIDPNLNFYVIDNAVNYTAVGLSSVDNNSTTEKAEVLAIVKAVIYDNPQYFWIFQNGFGYDLNNDFITLAVAPEYATDTARASAWTTIQSEINVKLGLVDDLTTPYEVETMFHEAIINVV